MESHGVLNRVYYPVGSPRKLLYNIQSMYDIVRSCLQFLQNTGIVKYSPGHFHFGRLRIENTGLRNAKVAPCTIGNLRISQVRMHTL